MTLRPAPADTGIVVRRVDLDGAPAVAARWDRVVDTRMATTIGNEDGVRVGTVEHLMAALAGCEIDNAVIELDGPEVPVMDGSAAPFVFLIECAGTVEQASPRRAIEVLKRVAVGDDTRQVAIAPGPVFEVAVEIDFGTRAIERQSYGARIVNGTFKAEIARARTFGFAEDVNALRSAGLARGGSLDNAIVISDGQVLNADGLRYADEFVRHKVLDCIGDMYLAGAPLLGRVDGLRSGHTLHHRLLEALVRRRVRVATRGRACRHPRNAGARRRRVGAPLAVAGRPSSKRHRARPCGQVRLRRAPRTQPIETA